MNTDTRDTLSIDTQPMEVLPVPRPAIDPPILVEALAAHGDVPEQDVVEHLSSLFDDVYEGRIPGVRPLDRPAWVLKTYLEDFVAVG